MVFIEWQKFNLHFRKKCASIMFTINQRRCSVMILTWYVSRGPEPTDLDDLIFSDDTWNPSDK